ncbi:MAG: hypothetical protein R8L07_05415 [Alphaproteobacteria bacterium]|nr:hypothetical protein [Alphaproteobacteria bacterium]
MLIDTTLQAHAFEFVRYNRLPETTPEDLAAAVLEWQEGFLAHQDGVVQHAFLGNLRGEFGDILLMRDSDALARLEEPYQASDYSKRILSLIDTNSIRFSFGAILKDGISAVRDFTCVEFGSFALPADSAATADTVRAASDRIEATYLAESENTREHFTGQMDDRTYCEIVFGRTLAATRRTCLGYVGNADCQPLLDLFDPETVDLDFWTVLA